MRTAHIHSNQKTILFCAFNARNYSCSPKAVYEYCISSPDYQDYNYIWSFLEPEKYRFLEENLNTTLVRHGSKEYISAVARAGVWVFNFRVPDHIYPNRKQIYLQCWHGTPLKRLGYDIKIDQNAKYSLREIRKRYKREAKKMTYLLSPSRFASEKFFSAWNLKELGKQDAILELGYPRNDVLHKYKQEDVQQILRKLGFAQEKRKIILYAPTWRDDQHTAGFGYTYQLGIDFDKLRAALGRDYILLFRAHYLVASKFHFKEYDDFILDVSNYDDVNDLYLVSDMLITDYSSVFFDYASLKRPILFYMYDKEKYQDELRGFYIEPASLPGPVLTTQEELTCAILNQDDEFQPDQRYRDFLAKVAPLDDGQAAKRVADYVLLNKKSDVF